MSDLRGKILTNDTARKMETYVSPIYGNSYVGLWMLEVIGREYDEPWDIIRTFPNQLTPASATWSIELWEQRYGIVPPPGATFQQRREALLAKRAIPGAFNPHALKLGVSGITGQWSDVNEHAAPYTFAVHLDVSEGFTDATLRRVRDFIERRKPAHMSYDLDVMMSARDTVYVGIVPRIAIQFRIGQVN
jgi:Uncharacterized protein conserved in bacteria